MSGPLKLKLMVALAAACLCGCPRSGDTKKTPAPCTELGQQCEFSPGKLGACSYKANCTGAGCLYCQSQH
jgi:hypothetical protein